MHVHAVHMRVSVPCGSLVCACIAGARALCCIVVHALAYAHVHRCLCACVPVRMHGLCYVCGSVASKRPDLESELDGSCPVNSIRAYLWRTRGQVAADKERQRMLVELGLALHSMEHSMEHSMGHSMKYSMEHSMDIFDGALDGTFGRTVNLHACDERIEPELLVHRLELDLEEALPSGMEHSMEQLDGSVRRSIRRSTRWGQLTDHSTDHSDGTFG